MPLVLDDSQELQEGARATLPAQPQDTTPAPSGLDVAAAAERQANVAGMAYERYFANPKPEAPAVPGFDPIASVPKGFEPYADRFLDAQSPQEVQWIKGRIQGELQDRDTIRRAGGWGVAASLAAGATDPLTIASMALPAAGETRLATAARLALINAGTSAAQEGIAQQLSETRTPTESLTNIGAGAILGGVLGAAIRPRVPLAEFERLRTNLDADLRVVNPGAESTVGAAAVPKSDLAGNTIAAGARTIAEGPIGQVAPGLRLLTSPSNEAIARVTGVPASSVLGHKELDELDRLHREKEIAARLERIKSQL